jgi:transcriptional regulator with PAS, ATPase and Fis domain
VGDLNELSQVKLLRLLEEGTYFPLGADMPEQSDVRIIASSNKDLQELVTKGLFRQDLYYRLCTHHVHIPPLRERKEDIPLLLDHFIREASGSLKKKKPVLSRELINLLSNYYFPGNIRELQAMVYDAVAQHERGSAFLDIFKTFIKKKGALPKSDYPVSVQSASSVDDVFGHFPTFKETEAYLIADALKRAEGNQGIAASMLGISRQALNRRLKNKE